MSYLLDIDELLLRCCGRHCSGGEFTRERGEEGTGWPHTSTVRHCYVLKRITTESPYSATIMMEPIARRPTNPQHYMGL
jgi:hypothetical protein